MARNRDKDQKQPNQTGSQSGNPRNQQLQRNQQSGNEGMENQGQRHNAGSENQNVDEPRKRRGNAGGDKRHGGNR
jgi:hypothetical protein